MSRSEATGKAPMPCVSVIMPAYNAAAYIERALNSALDQTMRDLEVIVVDDASSDATIEVSQTLAARDSRVRVLQNERNVGLAVSRNRAINAARGEWVALLDADDEWLPKRLEQMLLYAAHVDVVSDDIYIVRSSNIGITRAATGTPKLWSLLQREGMKVSTPRRLCLLEFAKRDLGLLKPMIRRSFLQRNELEHNPGLCHVVDFTLWFEILASGALWLQLPNAYYLYYIHTGSMSKDTHTLMQEVIHTAQSLAEQPTVAEDAALVRALESRVQEARSISAYDSMRNHVLERQFAKLARLLREQPSYFPLALRWAAKRLYVRTVRRSY